MGIIIDRQKKVLIMGITGKEGSRATKEMLESGTNVVCGVTPGKGGTTICDKPVFDSAKEAATFNHEIDAAVLFVPPLMVYDAAIECLENDIKTIVIVTENVPIKDTAKIIAIAREKKCRIIGPSSVGIITIGEGKLGSISTDPKLYLNGNIGIISKSGGLCSETAYLLTRNSLGQSSIVSIGGDSLIGSSFSDLLELFQEDNQTKAVVLLGEVGGTYEEDAAELLIKRKFTKPLVCFISGKFVESLNLNMNFGHTGAIVEYGVGRVEDKKNILKNAGAIIAESYDDIPQLLKQALEKNGI